MPLLTQQARTAKATGTALTYITVGAILTVLSGTSFFFFSSPFEENRVLGYIRAAILLVGIVLLVIGLAVGQISRTARDSETDRDEGVVHASANQARAHADKTKTG